MALKTGIFSLALGALLLGSTAQADEKPHFASGAEAQAQGFHGGHGQPHYRRTPRPAPPRYEQGRYELKLVRQFVPGRYEQVWVPEDCRYRPRRGTTQCRGGYYEQRWVPGYYETVEQWVWVPSRWHRSSAAPASYQY